MKKLCIKIRLLICQWLFSALITVAPKNDPEGISILMAIQSHLRSQTTDEIVTHTIGGGGGGPNAKTNEDYQEEVYSSNGILNIDLSIENIFTFTPTENVTKLHISNWTKNIDRQSMTLVLTQPESAYDIDFGNILWARGITPDIKKNLTKYVIIIFSPDEGITQYGSISTVL
jgi:hypothetical protein